jgi:hypothetical protein
MSMMIKKNWIRRASRYSFLDWCLTQEGHQLVWVAIHHDSAYLAQPLVVLVLVAPTAAAAIATASPSGGKSSFLSIFIFCRSLYIFR